MEEVICNLPTTEDEFCYRIYCIERDLSKFFSNILRDFNLTFTQYTTLLILWNEEEPMRMTELTKRLQLDCGTTSPLFKRMERNNWIVRKYASDDRRKIYIELTQNGREQQKAINERVTRCLLYVSSSQAEHEQDNKTIARMKSKLKKANDYLEDLF